MSEIEIAIKLLIINCGECGAPIALTENHERQLRESHRTFYCPNGHPRHYPAKTEAELLRTKLHAAELDKTRLANQVNALTQVNDEVRAEVNKAQAETAKLKKRVAAGTCPCCKRTFSQLARHMKSKHPEMAP